MDDSLSTVVIAGLATWQMVEVLHHSELTTQLRVWASQHALAGGWRSFVSRLVSCPFCLSHWVAGTCVLLLALSLEVLPYLGWTRYVVWIFAATRIANLGNDLAYAACRSPKHDLTEEDDVEVETGPEDRRLAARPAD